MSWKRFEYILSWISILALVVVLGYLAYLRMMPQTASNNNRQLFEFFLSTESRQESGEIIKPNELEEYLIPSATQSAEMELPSPELDPKIDEVQSSSRNVN